MIFSSTGISYSDNTLKEKLLPCLTFYAMPAYKKNGFHYSKDDYQNQTYNITDIFDNTTLEQLGNKSNLLYTETRSLFYGRGYTVCFNNKMATKNVTFIFWKIILTLNCIFIPRAKSYCLDCLFVLLRYVMCHIS